MRLFHIDANFLLPDDFRGSTLAALAELVRFLGDPKAGHADLPYTAQFGDARGNFHHNTRLGLRFSATRFGQWELVGRQPWRRVIDLKLPPRAYVEGEAMIK